MGDISLEQRASTQKITNKDESLVVDVIEGQDQKNRFCVDLVGQVGITGSNLSFDDMNVSNGGIARDTVLPTTFVNLYSYSGSGSLVAFLTNFENDSNFYIRLIADGHYPFFGVNGFYMNDGKDGNIYDIKDLSPTLIAGLGMSENTVRYEPRTPLKFETNLTVQARTTTNKKFKAGFVSIIKDL